MTAYSFSKLVPGGNPTIILHEPDLSPGELSTASAVLMGDLHLQAEQAGALYAASRSLPRLQMMGGEFCVNATRAAATVLARQGRLSPRAGAGPLWVGQLEVSGTESPVTVAVGEEAAALAGLLREMLEEPGCRFTDQGEAFAGAEGMAQPFRLFAAALVSLEGVELIYPGDGLVLVRMPGMSHLLVDTTVHALPESLRNGDGGWKADSSAWRAACGLGDAPASGVVWHARYGDGFRIWPAVEVRATASEHLESACGSASLAVALAGITCGRAEAASVVPVTQPSGKRLDVLLGQEKSRGSAALAAGRAWVSGPADLVAEGIVYL